MADTYMSRATLLDGLAGLDPQARRALATTLRRLSETFAELPDGQKAGYVLGVLAHLLYPD